MRNTAHEFQDTIRLHMKTRMESKKFIYPYGTPFSRTGPRTQCAAVSTYLPLMSTPPHNRYLSPVLFKYSIITAHGYWSIAASFAPEIKCLAISLPGHFSL